MGYRFTLKSANTVANLTFGKVMSCYRDIYSSAKSYEEFIFFLDQFHQNLYSNEAERYLRSIQRIRNILRNYGKIRSSYGIEISDDPFLHYHRVVLDALRELSDILMRCTIKSLLLPPMKDDKQHEYDFMTSSRTLERLVELHQGDSCLILQPQERPLNATIFDAFPNFDIALRQADTWPAVLFWEDSNNYVFIPIEHEDELLRLYEIVKYESHPINEIKKIAECKRKASCYVYQLSDLHFGAKNTDIAERRLKSLLKLQLSRNGFDDNVLFVITGDVVDSPRPSTMAEYSDFAEYLEDRCGQKPIRVLGNHDINNHGLAIFHRNQQITKIVSEYPKIEIIEEQRTVFLLFNSNTNGSLAEGEIGIRQMSEMGNLLDGIANLERYRLIAVLHHHLLPIPKPDYQDQQWFERIIPSSFMDMSLKLIDATLFFEWLRKRNVRIVLHGHKHIPFFTVFDGITVIGCGSSTGQITHKEKNKTFISYNLLRINDKTVTCTQFAEEVFGAGAENIRAEIIEL